MTLLLSFTVFRFAALALIQLLHASVAGTSESDLDYYVRESGGILDVLDSLETRGGQFAIGKHELTSKQILHFVMKKLVAFKKMDNLDA